MKVQRLNRGAPPTPLAIGQKVSEMVKDGMKLESEKDPSTLPNFTKGLDIALVYSITVRSSIVTGTDEGGLSSYSGAGTVAWKTVRADRLRPQSPLDFEVTFRDSKDDRGQPDLQLLSFKLRKSS